MGRGIVRFRTRETVVRIVREGESGKATATVGRGPKTEFQSRGVGREIEGVTAGSGNPESEYYRCPQKPNGKRQEICPSAVEGVLKFEFRRGYPKLSGDASDAMIECVWRNERQFETPEDIFESYGG
jgi:hypothetical protein